MSDRLTAELGSAPAEFTTHRKAQDFVTNPATLFALAVIAVVIFFAVAADLIAPYDPTKQVLELRRTGPSPQHLLGVDSLGRDMLSRLIFGARATLLSGGLAVGISLSVGVLLGLVAGFRGGLLGATIMRLVDLLLAFPSFLLAIVLVAILEPSLTSAAGAIGIAGIPTFARLVRGSVLSVRERPFVLSALASGASDGRIMFKYILPNVTGPIVVLGTLSLGTAILSVAGLGFLGLGAQPPAPEWGVMVGDGREFLDQAPHISMFPGIAIMLLVISVNLLGETARERPPSSSKRPTQRRGVHDRIAGDADTA